MIRSESREFGRAKKKKFPGGGGGIPKYVSGRKE